MKRLVTAFLFTSLLLLGSTAEVRAQAEEDGYPFPQVPNIFMFETLPLDSAFFNANYHVSAPRSYFNFDQLDPNVYGVAPRQGDGALVIDWGVFADQSWGGSSGIGHVLPADYLPDSLDQLYDFSDFTHIHVWYNVLQPASKSGMTMRLKLHDASLGIGTSGDSETEDWNASVVSASDGVSPLAPTAAAGWQEAVIPLENLGIGVNPSAEGFSRPGCQTGSDPESRAGCWSGLLGNEELDLDQISGVQFEFFAGTGVQTGDSTATGVIVFDNMYVSGVRYDLISGFESAPGGWNNGSGTSTRTVVDDAIEGEGAFQFEYDVVGDAGWGGSADVQVVTSDVPNMAAREALSIFYKVTEPLTKAAEDNDVRLVVKLFDNSTGDAREPWQYTTYDVLGDTTGQWQRLVMPFDEFALPSWETQGDATLNLDAIAEIQLQVILAEGDEGSGTILFDRLTTYGDAPVEKDPPVAVANFSAMASPVEDFANLLSWEDIPGEEDESYDIYYSLSPIDDLEAEGVLLAAADVAEGTEAFTHRIFHPVDDGQITYYYAIRATDVIGQESPLTTSDAVENTAMGIPTISLNPPAEFAADGDLSEWSGITPFHLSPDDDELGYIPQTDAGYTVDNDADLSADVYLAVDDEALYFAFDVTDDVFVTVPDDVTENRWLYDGAELYIGLYNELHPRHTGQMSSGDEPDYKFYIYPQEVFRDGTEGPVLGHQDTDENYYFQAKSSGDGYIVEGKLPFDDENFTYEGVATFVPENGMRVPLDVTFMDNDEAASVNRQGILTYSYWNDDNSYQSPRNWFYTWIGNQLTVPIEGDATDLPGTYALGQNYPNPFNPSTIITYDLPQASHVTLKVFNVLGQQVALLVDREQTANRYEVRFDAQNLPSGVYFYQLKAGDFVTAKKMMLVR